MYVHLSEIEILIIENIIAMETRKRNCFNGWKIVSIYVYLLSEGGGGGESE
jgi:hypothetical protein